MVTIYNADVWCEDCGEDLKRQIAKELVKEIQPLLKKKFPKSVVDFPSERLADLEQAIIEICDNSTMDSDDWPQSGYPEEATDSPQHCGAGEDCLNAEELSDGSKVGKLLGTELTEHGVDYLNAMLSDRPSGKNIALHEFWRGEFHHYDLIEEGA